MEAGPASHVPLSPTQRSLPDASHPLITLPRPELLAAVAVTVAPVLNTHTSLTNLESRS